MIAWFRTGTCRATLICVSHLMLLRGVVSFTVLRVRVPCIVYGVPVTYFSVFVVLTIRELSCCTCLTIRELSCCTCLSGYCRVSYCSLFLLPCLSICTLEVCFSFASSSTMDGFGLRLVLSPTRGNNVVLVTKFVDENAVHLLKLEMYSYSCDRLTAGLLCCASPVVLRAPCEAQCPPVCCCNSPVD